jgi:hypothetical protein
MELKPNPFLVGSLTVDGQTQLWLTLPTAIVLALVIFVTAFLLGLWCGWMWRRRRG